MRPYPHVRTVQNGHQWLNVACDGQYEAVDWYGRLHTAEKARDLRQA